MSSRELTSVIFLAAYLSLSGCSMTIHSTRSFPSLLEENEFAEKELDPLDDLPATRISVSGIDIDIRIHNDVTLRAYDTSFMIPIKTYDARTDQSGSDKGDIPFNIDLYLIADGEGATFTPSSTKLYFDKNPAPIYPVSIYGSEKGVRCGKRPIRTHIYTTNIDNHPITIEPVSVVNKHTMKEGEETHLANQTCIRLAFDVATPEPSQKFHVHLGNIKTSSGKTIGPVIYFNPVYYKSWSH